MCQTHFHWGQHQPNVILGLYKYRSSYSELYTWARNDDLWPQVSLTLGEFWPHNDKTPLVPPGESRGEPSIMPGVVSRDDPGVMPGRSQGGSQGDPSIIFCLSFKWHMRAQMDFLSRTIYFQMWFEQLLLSASKQEQNVIFLRISRNFAKSSDASFKIAMRQTSVKQEEVKTGKC